MPRGRLPDWLADRLLAWLEPHLVGFVLRHYEAPAERLAKLQALAKVRERFENIGFDQRPSVARMRWTAAFCFDRLQWEFGGGEGSPAEDWLALAYERRPLALHHQRRLRRQPGQEGTAR